MNKLAIMLLLTAIGVGGSLALSPFYGVAVYYLFATLRPQFLWEWALPPDVPWSYYVALATIFSVAVWRIGLMLAPHWQRGFRAPRLNVGHWAMLFFAGWITLTTFTAHSVPVAKPFYDEYQKIFIMFFVAAFAITSLRQLWSLYLIVTLALAYVAIDVNHIYLSSGYMFIYKRGYAGLDNNGAALMLAMGVPLCLYAWDGTRHWSRWAFLLFVPLLIHAVLTSYSRGAMLALILSIPIYLIRCRNRRQLAVILLGIAAMLPILAGREIQNRFFSIDEHDRDASAQSRLTTWGIAWRMACERPLLGFGVRNSSLFTKEYGADMDGRVIHSQYLQIAADSGLVGLAAYLAVIGATVYCLVRARRSAAVKRLDPHSDRARTIANGMEGALFVFCFGGLFLSLETFELPYLGMLMAAQLAALAHMKVSAPVTATVQNRASAWPIPAGATV